jgi:hypothetical protein
LISLTWTDGSTAAAFRLYRSTDGGLNWNEAGAAMIPGFGLLDSPVATEQSICYHVVAYNAAGDAPPSNTACATPPAGPTDLVATAIDDATLELTWTDLSSVETGYEVRVISRWRSDCFTAGYSEYHSVVTTLGPNTTTWQTARTAPTCHDSPTYYVVATRDGGRSDPSNEVSPY